jgi:hypothetical protein
MINIASKYATPEIERAAAEFELQRARDGVARWQAEIDNPASTYQRKYIEHHLRHHQGKVADLTAALGTLENDDMRHVDEPATNDLQHPWRACRQLRFADKTYQRGAVIPDEIVNASLNVAALIAGRHIARLPASPSPAPRPPFQPRQVTQLPDDPVAICRKALSEMAERRGCTRRDAVDLIPSDILLRAIKAIGEITGTVEAGAWGGGKMLTPNGIGNHRRISDHAVDVLCAD